MENYMNLFRPVGLKELELIEECNMQSFPPRLPWQPIFYPVLNEKYACEIAEKWNVGDEGSGYAGFVCKFLIDNEFVSRYEVQNVGSHYHNELWVPAAELSEFNSHICGNISIIKAFYGKQFTGIKKY